MNKIESMLSKIGTVYFDVYLNEVRCDIMGSVCKTSGKIFSNKNQNGLYTVSQFQYRTSLLTKSICYF